MHSFDPAEHPQRQIYKLMTGIIVPRPIALVSTRRSWLSPAHGALLPRIAPHRH
jgi:hypothetical protein